MTKNNRKPVFGVRIDQALINSIDALAEKTGTSRAEIATKCLIQGLANEQSLAEWLSAPRNDGAAALLMHPKVIETITRLIDKEANNETGNTKDAPRTGTHNGANPKLGRSGKRIQ